MLLLREVNMHLRPRRILRNRRSNIAPEISKQLLRRAPPPLQLRTCGGGVQNRIGVFNKINETVYEFVACKEERLSYFIYLDTSRRSSHRWTMGPNLDERDRLQHTPQSFALCPNNVVSWFSICTNNMKILFSHNLVGFEIHGQNFCKLFES